MYEVHAQQVDQLRLKLMQGACNKDFTYQTTVDAIYAPSGYLLGVSPEQLLIQQSKNWMVA